MQTRYQKLISQQSRDDDKRCTNTIVMPRNQIELALSQKYG